MRKTLIALLLCVVSLPLWAGLNPAADLVASGRIDEAMKVLNDRLASNPRDAEAYNLQARAYFAVKKWDAAIGSAEKSVALDPSNSDYHMWLGRAYAEKADDSSFIVAAGLVKKVKSEFEKAVELDANNLAARSDLAEFYVEAPGFMGGGKGKALAQAQTIAPIDLATSHWLVARVLEKEKKYPQAESEYKAAIQSSHNQASYWLNLASFYRRMGRLNDMENAVVKAMEADKRKNDVFYDAASLLFRAGRNFPAAAQFIRRYLTGPAVEDAPTVQAHYLLGEILEKQGDKASAIQEYRAALSLAKDYGQAQDALRRLQAAK